MTNEELRERLWNLESDMAKMRKGLRRQSFQVIRAMATRYVDKQGNIQWELIEKALFEPTGTGPIIMTARPPDWARRQK
jgi:hypothetical protein